MFDVLKKIYRLLHPKRQKQIIWLGLAMFVMGFVELGLAGAISLLGVALADPASLEKVGPLWTVFQWLPSFGGDWPQTIRMLIFVMALVSVATIVKNVVTAVMTYWQNVVSQAVGWDISIKLFDNYLAAPYIWHMQENPGELFNYLSWRGQCASFFLGALQVFSQIGIMLFLMLGAFVVAPAVSLLLYGIIGLVALGIYRAAQQRARYTGHRLAQWNVEVSRVVHAALHGIREVQIYRQQDAFRENYVHFAEPTSREEAQRSLYPPMPHWWLESVGMLLLLAVVVLMALWGESVAAVTGTLTLMAAVSWRLLPAANKVVGGILQLKTFFSPVQILLTKYLVLPKVHETAAARKFSQNIDLDNVSFSYGKANNRVLHHVHLHIKKGSMVGLVGLSGAGKSTLVGIVTGLFCPTEGKVLVDGVEVQPTPGFLNIGYVPQSPYIIDASLAKNVAFASWGEQVDEERVLKCCRMAAMNFLDDLPQGINTVLGDRGVRLSGGQVQRVAIARALYGNPDVLLFDEATSALDGAAEASIQNTILNLRKDMTIVMVAHRLSTVENCDILYWLQDGKIWRHGPTGAILPEYKEFLQKHGTFSCNDDGALE